jgi:hypothetical protein
VTSWLADAELEDFTGYKLPAYQLDWLQRNGFVEKADFFINAAGKPRLLRAALERRQAPTKATVRELRAVEPNLAAVR